MKSKFWVIVIFPFLFNWIVEFIASISWLIPNWTLFPVSGFFNFFLSICLGYSQVSSSLWSTLPPFLVDKASRILTPANQSINQSIVASVTWLKQAPPAPPCLWRPIWSIPSPADFVRMHSGYCSTFLLLLFDSVMKYRCLFRDHGVLFVGSKLDMEHKWSRPDRLLQKHSSRMVPSDFSGPNDSAAVFCHFQRPTEEQKLDLEFLHENCTGLYLLVWSVDWLIDWLIHAYYSISDYLYYSSLSIFLASRGSLHYLSWSHSRNSHPCCTSGPAVKRITLFRTPSWLQPPPGSLPLYVLFLPPSFSTAISLCNVIDIIRKRITFHWSKL